MKEKLLKLLKNKVVVFGGVVLLILGSLYNGKEELKADLKSVSRDSEPVEEKILVCDGINITENCKIDGIEYSIYKYYPAVEETSHMETITTYQEEIVGYCTLCNDGTYSPTCATGRGACSHHGGVAEWNAPIYNKVAHYDQKKVVDSPAVDERYERIEKH